MKSIFYIRSRYAVIGTILLVSFSTYFMTAIMPISPVYFTTLLGLFFLASQIYYKKSKSSLIPYSFHVLYSLLFILQVLLLNGNAKEAFVSFFWGLYYIWVDLAINQVNDKEEANSILKWNSVFFFIYYIIDIILRINTMHSSSIPSWIQANQFYMFYMIKRGGVYGDSNAIGVFSLIYFSVCYFAYKRKMVKKIFPYLSFIMVVLTASRAALISALSLLLFEYLFLRRNIVFRFFMSFCFVLLIFIVLNILSGDPSFQSKFEIMRETAVYLNTCSVFQFLFGNGPNSSNEIFGLYAHNIWSILVVEYGIIHTIVFLFVLILTCIDVGKSSVYVLIPYLIVSLSFTPIHLQFLFSGFALLKLINRFN